MNQTKGGLETGDVVVYHEDLTKEGLSKEEAKARGKAEGATPYRR